MYINLLCLVCINMSSKEFIGNLITNPVDKSQERFPHQFIQKDLSSEESLSSLFTNFYKNQQLQVPAIGTNCYSRALEPTQSVPGINGPDESWNRYQYQTKPKTLKPEVILLLCKFPHNLQLKGITRSNQLLLNLRLFYS